ncbi:MAG: linear amide C-N hydrolase [Hydrogenovibrio sp.]
MTIAAQVLKLKASRLKWGLTLMTALTGMGVYQTSQACTRVVYLGEEQQIMTGRTMDWKYDIGTNLWLFPRGMHRDGVAGPNSLQWTSKYGSVIASGYDVSTTDGVNEKGLVANLLWLAESQYPKVQPGKTPISISVWAQYVLDQFATVAETVAALEKSPLTVVTDKVPGQNRQASLHLAISDATGDSAIIEYIDGKQVIHHGRQYQVMTNSPTYDKQLAMEEYWAGIGGTLMLPGSNRSPDRFARASFYINAIPQKTTPNKAVASVLSVVRNVSVPYGLQTPDAPEISSTRWRTVVDHKRQLYFFESALTPSGFWTDLKKIDFSEKTGQVKKLDLGPDQTRVLHGEVSGRFVASEPFPFQGLSAEELAY